MKTFKEFCLMWGDENLPYSNDAMELIYDTLLDRGQLEDFDAKIINKAYSEFDELMDMIDDIESDLNKVEDIKAIEIIRNIIKEDNLDIENNPLDVGRACDLLNEYGFFNEHKFDEVAVFLKERRL